MKTIENDTSLSTSFMTLFKVIIIANFVGCIFFFKALGLLVAIPGTIGFLMFLRAETKSRNQGNIHLSESGFTIEKYSKQEVPWSAIESLDRHVIPYTSGSQLIFRLSDRGMYPHGYPAITDKSYLSKHYYGTGVFCANLMGYKISPLDIHSCFKQMHENWQKNIAIQHKND